MVDFWKMPQRPGVGQFEREKWLGKAWYEEETLKLQRHPICKKWDLNIFIQKLRTLSIYRPWARRLQRSLCRCPDGQPRRQARHRQRLSPRAAADRAELWLCPCQTKTPAIATAVQLEKEESRAVGESRF
ncbi:hypothetical protein E2320_017600 [Naja naja]|nr:hypothetical protein E2320_017600 [Naja naja]